MSVRLAVKKISVVTDSVFHSCVIAPLHHGHRGSSVAHGPLIAVFTTKDTVKTLSPKYADRVINVQNTNMSSQYTIIHRISTRSTLQN